MNLNTLPLFPTVLGLDIETDGLDRFSAQITAVGLSDGEDTWVLTEDYERLIPLLEDPSVLKVIHNADFDLTVLCFRMKVDHHIEVKPQNIYDTLLVERVLNNGLSISNKLEDVLARRLGVLVDKSLQESFTGGGLSEDQLHYIENDCKHLIRLRDEQMKEVSLCGMEWVIDLENKDVLVTLDKTLTGIGIDLEQFEAIRAQIPAVLDQILFQIKDVLGEDFVIEVERTKKGEKYTEEIPVSEIKWNAWQQLKPALHKVGVKVNNTQRGTLEERQDQHPLIPLVLEYKTWFKMLGWHWDEFINPITGRIHPNWNQLGPITARFSCSDPNMQQIPRPDGIRPNFRSLFLPLPNHKLLVADWSQQEPRILAHVSQDEKMIAAANSSDIYSAFGKDVWGEEITKKDPRRQIMKIGVLASFYGVWYVNLASRMGLSEKEAEKLQKKIFNTYRKAKQWGDYQIKGVMQHGYTQSVMGRRIYFEDTSPRMQWRLKKESRNYPIQTTGADMAKLAEVKIYDIIQKKNYDAHFIIGLHDELVLSCHESQAQDCFADMKQAMMEAGSEICPSVQFPVEGVVSDKWEH